MNTECRKIPYFSYGSNNIDQLKKRIKNDNIMAYKAYLLHYVRIFSGHSKKWNGSVASLEYFPNEIVKGSIIYLSNDELQKLDKFEGIKDNDPYNTDSSKNIYARKNIKVQVFFENIFEEIEAITYIRNDHTIKQKPQEAYIDACYENLKKFWEISKEEIYDITNYEYK